MKNIKLFFVFLVITIIFNLASIAENKLPREISPGSIKKIQHWNTYINHNSQSRIWVEVRNKKDSSNYTYSWRSRSNLDSAFNSAMKACEDNKKKFSFSKKDLCLVMFVNEEPTSEIEKIEYANKYYKKKLVTQYFGKDNDIQLAKNSSQKAKTQSSNKIKIIKNTESTTGKKAAGKFVFKNDKNCVADKKNNILKFLDEGRFLRKYCLKSSDIILLGTYKPIKKFPESMFKVLNKGCKSESCNYKKASAKMYEIFVRRGDQYHTRNPGAMIHGMAWYELMYWGKLKKTQKAIDTYLKYGPNNYPENQIFFKHKHEAAIASLIKMNIGRKNMREAMGMNINDDIESVIQKHWVLGDFLNNDKLKVKKIVMDPKMKKRKILLEKYQATLKRYKKKLEEDKDKKKVKNENS
jgi:hypothetical protein